MGEDTARRGYSLEAIHECLHFDLGYPVETIAATRKARASSYLNLLELTVNWITTDRLDAAAGKWETVCDKCATEMDDRWGDPHPAGLQIRGTAKRRISRRNRRTSACCGLDCELNNSLQAIQPNCSTRRITPTESRRFSQVVAWCFSVGPPYLSRRVLRPSGLGALY